MKTLGYLLTILLATTMLACQKQSPVTKKNGDSELEQSKMSDLKVSETFNWSTTSDVEIEVNLPADNLDDLLTISDANSIKIFFKGYRDDKSQTLKTIITIPSYISQLKLKYGDSENYPDIILDVEPNLLADYSVYSNGRSICGCDDGVRSLTMTYNGSSSAQIKVEEEVTGIELFNSVVNANTNFTFIGSATDGKMDEMINFFIDGNYNSSIITNCTVDLFAGDIYGSFEINSGMTDNFIPLCHKAPGTPVVIGYTGTLAYEDLWPSEGDYDFNDLVISYDFNITKNSLEEIEKIDATFTLKAIGASYYNGFGFSFPGISPDQISSVSGYSLKSNSIISLLNNGVEANQTTATIIVFDDCFDVLQHPGSGIGINTDPLAPYVTPISIKLEIKFIENGNAPPGGTVNFRQLNIGHYNPFLIVNQERGKEIHLPYYAPTDLANMNYFGKWSDDSNIGAGRYYVTRENYPWAIIIPETFEYPYERTDITNAYNNFKGWVESDGQINKDWFKNMPNYRNTEFIYQTP